MEIPEIEKTVDWIDNIVRDFASSLIGIQILGLMLIGYPSLVEKFISPIVKGKTAFED